MRRYYFVLLMVAFFGCISGCLGETEESVQQFIEMVRKRKSDRIEGVPKFEPLSVFEYGASTLRSPFEPLHISSSKHALDNSVLPVALNLRQRQEPLEWYPLDALEMVGSLEKDKTTWAILKDKENKLHRVGIGNYVGQNFGKIEQITEKCVLLTEWIQTMEGGWESRKATIQLCGE